MKTGAVPRRPSEILQRSLTLVHRALDEGHHNRQHGTADAAVLVAARRCGALRVFKLGGAQAIAAMAFGTDTIRRVDKIPGPGNAYVAAAQRRVFGRLGIDMIARPPGTLAPAARTAHPAWSPAAAARPTSSATALTPCSAPTSPPARPPASVNRTTSAAPPKSTLTGAPSNPPARSPSSHHAGRPHKPPAPVKRIRRSAHLYGR